MNLNISKENYKQTIISSYYNSIISYHVLQFSSFIHSLFGTQLIYLFYFDFKLHTIGEGNRVGKHCRKWSGNLFTCAMTKTYAGRANVNIASWQESRDYAHSKMRRSPGYFIRVTQKKHSYANVFCVICTFHYFALSIFNLIQTTTPTTNDACR